MKSFTNANDKDYHPYCPLAIEVFRTRARHCSHCFQYYFTSQLGCWLFFCLYFILSLLILFTKLDRQFYVMFFY
ncbi:hypothetical protein MC53_002440 [Proteus mirabilis]|nr:hypothetical protein MC53_002440 [Proteus mirabilis]AUU35413.1 hypothetical protein MC72_008565 [Proteus mirabilis]AUU39113.1 hypothetical protein MC73_009090 [Proteus mirabilis]PNO89165.1 hypothetical protein MC76_002005 [Proteus mirabilis]